MNDVRGNSPIGAALLKFTLIVITLTLGGCNSSDDGKFQPSNEITAEEPTVRGSDSVAAQDTDGTANQRSEKQSIPFSPSFTPRDCLEMTSPEVVANILQNDPAITCGQVSVPANWNKPNGNMIELAVYRVAPTTNFPVSDPLVVLAGGPGQTGIGILLHFVDGNISYLRERSEVIVVDQRGTGFSAPSLVCPAAAAIKQEDNTDMAPKTIEALYTAIQRELLACAENLSDQNVNLADYTTANNARDIEAIRQALGVDQWNLFGVSYGTTLALTIMRDWPEGVRSAVLDSAVPIQVNLLTEQTYAKGYWPLSRIVENCKADTDCHEIIGDIQLSIEAGIARLDTAPVGLFDAQRYLLAILATSIGNPDLASLIEVVAFRSDEVIADVFNLNTEFDSDTNAPDEPVVRDSVPTPIADTPPGLIPMLRADVMYAAIICAEEATNSETTASPDISSNFQQTTRDVINHIVESGIYTESFCNQLDILPADPIENQAVRSNLPALVLAGDTDTSSPPAWSKRVAETLPHSQYVEFPRAGHGLSIEGFDCSPALLLSFLDAPEKMVDRTCVDALPPVDYHIWNKSGTHTGSDPVDGMIDD